MVRTYWGNLWPGNHLPRWRLGMEVKILDRKWRTQSVGMHVDRLSIHWTNIWMFIIRSRKLAEAFSCEQLASILWRLQFFQRVVFSVSGWWGAPRHSMQNILQHSTWRFDRIACHGWAECNKFCRRSFTRAMPHPHHPALSLSLSARPSKCTVLQCLWHRETKHTYIHKQNAVAIPQ